MLSWWAKSEQVDTGGQRVSRWTKSEQVESEQVDKESRWRVSRWTKSEQDK